MNSITNRFAALSTSETPRPQSPPYPPTPLTAAEVAYVRKLDEEMKTTPQETSGRFRSWARDSDSASSTQNIFGGGRKSQQPYSRTPTVRQEDIAASEGKYRPPAFREAIVKAKKAAPLDSSSAEQFPSLGGGASAPKKAWGPSQTFAKKVADLAERERNDEIRRKLEEEDEERRRMRESVVIHISNRFRRPLEAVLTEGDDEGMDQGFDDDHYEPSNRYEMSDDYDDQGDQQN